MAGFEEKGVVEIEDGTVDVAVAEVEDDDEVALRSLLPSLPSQTKQPQKRFAASMNFANSNHTIHHPS